MVGRMKMDGSQFMVCALICAANFKIIDHVWLMSNNCKRVDSSGSYNRSHRSVRRSLFSVAFTITNMSGSHFLRGTLTKVDLSNPQMQS